MKRIAITPAIKPHHYFSVKVFVISLLSALLVFPAVSYAVPIAQGTISVSCGSVSETRVVTSTDSISCTNTAAGFGGTVTTNATTAINFTTAPSTSASADASGSGWKFDAQSGGGSSTKFFVGLVSLVTPPVTIATIPVSFTASGGVTIDGGIYSGTSLGSAFTQFRNPHDPSFTFPTDDFSILVSGVGAAAFDETFTLDLALPPPGEYFNVLMGAFCAARAIAPGGPDDPIKAGSTSCSAFLDPVFAFDQAAFDIQMGMDTFMLADYYRIDLSENLIAPPQNGGSVPEPATLALMGFGVAGLGFTRRKKA